MFALAPARWMPEMPFGVAANLSESAKRAPSQFLKPGTETPTTSITKATPVSVQARLNSQVNFPTDLIYEFGVWTAFFVWISGWFYSIRLTLGGKMEGRFSQSRGGGPGLCQT
jgi:hypothetical protein